MRPAISTTRATNAGTTTTTVTAIATKAIRKTPKNPIGLCHATARFHNETTRDHGVRSVHANARPGTVTCTRTNAGPARQPSECPNSWASTPANRAGGNDRAAWDVTATVRPNGAQAFNSFDSTTNSRYTPPPARR
ncbi:hypothetical protein GCM10022254_49940 [Actinomadura meridiana]|uniref:Uncharacterized protein n=1 Tax=Actinomadura meridiana TaxID=559626 RepID=A0ABP8CCE2_9ACTN